MSIITNSLRNHGDKFVTMFRDLSVEEQNRLINESTLEELEVIMYNWDIWAREKQLAYRRKDFFICLVRCGRGFGKTRMGSEAILEWERLGARYLGIANANPGAIRSINIDGESGIIACAPPWNRPVHEVTKRRLVWPSGAIANTFSGAAPEESRGYQSDKLLIDELLSYKYPEEVFSNLSLGCRLGPNPQILITSTPKNTAFMRKLSKGSNTIIVEGSTFENKNLPQSFIDKMMDDYGNSRLGEQELYGRILEDNPGALFSSKNIDDNRISNVNKLYEALDGVSLTELQKVEVLVNEPISCVVVSVDPSVSEGENSNLTGIIVAGLGEKTGKGYVLEDATCPGTPLRWAKAVIEMYYKYDADIIIYEKNQGGNLIEANIKSVDDGVKCLGINASASKEKRATPIATKYEQNKVSHVGTFSDLELQMIDWEPGKESPDRLDALVHALTYLMITKKKASVLVGPAGGTYGYGINSHSIIGDSSSGRNRFTRNTNFKIGGKS